MVEHQPAPLDAIFHALGDATRRRMLRQLSAGEQTVGQLAQPFAISLAAASKLSSGPSCGHVPIQRIRSSQTPQGRTTASGTAYSSPDRRSSTRRESI